MTAHAVLDDGQLFNNINSANVFYMCCFLRGEKLSSFKWSNKSISGNLATVDNSHPMNDCMYISLGRPMSETHSESRVCVQYLEFDIIRGKKLKFND